jgi:carboxymethylenebutenolidase
LLYPTEHAFTRDEGPRFDPEATDLAFAETIRLFRKVFHN